MAPQKRESFVCPNCHADVPRGAAACPECGADDETGWSPDTRYDDLDLPEPGYGPEEEEEPAPDQSWLWKLVMIGVLIVFGVVAVFSF